MAILTKKKHHNNNKNAMLKLRTAVEKLQKSLILLPKRSSSSQSLCEPDDLSRVLGINGSADHALPDDVKEGHFAVVALENGQAKRFVVPLSYLSHPSFLRLLEQAAEEFGFGHEGALCIPCRWVELESILA